MKEEKDVKPLIQCLFSDRLGFHHVMMAVGIWPVVLATIGEMWRGQAAITRDVDDGLYSKTAYIITKVIIFFDSLFIHSKAIYILDIHPFDVS